MTFQVAIPKKNCNFTKDIQLFMYRILSLFLLLTLSINIYSQNFEIDKIENLCATSEEQKLYDLISQYRIDNGLSKVKFSRSLSFVARVHAMDLLQNRPDFGGCNTHSWSDKGKWKPCCYAQDNNRVLCMTSKPKELTSYKYKAYEVVYSAGERARAEDAFELWKNIEQINDYLLNTGKWTKPWLALGVGIYGEYACVWFGEGVDMAADLYDCVSDSLKADSAMRVTQIAVVPETPAYYIITSIASTKEQAEQAVMTLHKKGFSNAIYITNQSFYRIAINKFNDEQTANRELVKIKKQFPDAWLLKPKNTK